MKFPSILVVGNFLTREGGTTQVCEELSGRLHRAGHVVITTSGRKRRISRLTEMLYTTWRYRFSYDVAQVAVFSGASFIWAEAVCNLLTVIRCPYILTLHGGGLPEFARENNRRVRRLLQSAAAVTVPSMYLLDKMRAYRSDLTLIPNALDIAAYERTEHHMRPRLAWLRAFHDVYNPMMAPRVLCRLKDEFPPIHLMMIGPDKGDSSRAKTLAEAKRYGVETHLEMHSLLPKDQVPHVLKGADIFLNTSRIDNTPVSVLEAMAAGLCVVSTDVGGIPYLLKSGQEALLVPEGDDAAMAAAVRSLLRDQQLATKIRTTASRKLKNFDWSVVLPQWQDLLTSVARSKRQRSIWRLFPTSPRTSPQSAP
ncbi:MAG: glycosyl transferase family 1 [Candidatus Acidoferrum typicum]|nr:glycosyl transferase family 1 [Candidatus Acidoferrum typicum]